MIIQTSNYSSAQVSMEVIDDYNRSLFRGYLSLQQLDDFIAKLARHRAVLAASQQRQHYIGYDRYREAGPAYAGMNPSSNAGWDGSTGGGYGGGGCGNGL